MIQEKLDSISTNVSTLNWYAVYTKPRAEKKLKEALEKKSIQNFLPLITEKKKWSDRQKLISVPLFASYVFVKIDYSQDSLRVLQEPQVVQFVQYNGKPATTKRPSPSISNVRRRINPCWKKRYAISLSAN